LILNSAYKKIILYFTIFSLLFINSIPALSINTKSPPSLVGEAAILIDKNSGKILFEKNSDKIMYPASTTKIMTGILTLELGDLKDIVTVDSKTPFEISGSHIALEPGENLSVEKLLYATLIESANDAAVCLAKHIGGSVENFAKLMNDKALSLGLTNTNFVNPNGLPNPDHTTTAHDLAFIARYALQNEKFKSIVSKYKYTIDPTNKKDEPRYLHSENKMLYATGSGNKISVNGQNRNIYYEGAQGVKTGYTPVAGSCLVSYVKKDNMELISVVLKSSGKNIWVDTHKLLDYGFNNFDSLNISSKNEFIKNVNIENGEFPQVPAITNQKLSIVLSPDELSKVERTVIVPDSMDAPIYPGQILGSIDFTIDNNVVGNVKIVAANAVNRKPTAKLKVEGPSININKTLFYILIAYTSFLTLLIFLRIRKRFKQLS